MSTTEGGGINRAGCFITALVSVRFASGSTKGNNPHVHKRAMYWFVWVSSHCLAYRQQESSDQQAGALHILNSLLESGRDRFGSIQSSKEIRPRAFCPRRASFAGTAGWNGVLFSRSARHGVI